MLSMCGLLCRMLRGWRHSEAVMLMAKALSQPQSSLLVQNIDEPTPTGTVTVNEPGGTSLFCQNSSEGTVGQLLWRDNNKQAVIVIPRQKVNLRRWTLFLASSNNAPDLTTKKHDDSSSDNYLLEDPVSESSRTVTILLEASFREPEAEMVVDHHVMVEHLSQPYAWKARDTFGVIVTTTPPQLLAMIQAFFNNALIIDDDFLITKILTVDLVGEPSTLDDPLSIPESVTPGPWTAERSGLTPLELARSISPTNYPVYQLPSIATKDLESRGNSLHPPSLSNSLRHQSSESATEDTSTTLNPQSSSDSDKHPSSLDPQSSYESVSDYPTSDTDDVPCNVYNFYPRGWAISGSHVVSGQPLSVRGVISQLEGKTYNKTPCSIVTNPMEDLLQDPDESGGAKSNSSCSFNSLPNPSCLNGPSKNQNQEDRTSLLQVTRDSTPCLPRYRCMTGAVICKNLYAEPGRAEREIVQEAAQHYQRALYSSQEQREWTKRSSGSSGEEDGGTSLDYPFTPKTQEKSVVVTREPKRYPMRIRSEADLSRATSLIKDNLANIVENYLVKQSGSPDFQYHFPKIQKENPALKLPCFFNPLEQQVYMNGKVTEIQSLNEEHIVVKDGNVGPLAVVPFAEPVPIVVTEIKTPTPDALKEVTNALRERNEQIVQELHNVTENVAKLLGKSDDGENSSGKGKKSRPRAIMRILPKLPTDSSSEEPYIGRENKHKAKLTSANLAGVHGVVKPQTATKPATKTVKKLVKSEELALPTMKRVGRIDIPVGLSVELDLNNGTTDEYITDVKIKSSSADTERETAETTVHTPSVLETVPSQKETNVISETLVTTVEDNRDEVLIYPEAKTIAQEEEEEGATTLLSRNLEELMNNIKENYIPVADDTHSLEAKDIDDNSAVLEAAGKSVKDKIVHSDQVDSVVSEAHLTEDRVDKPAAIDEDQVALKVKETIITLSDREGTEDLKQDKTDIQTDCIDISQAKLPCDNSKPNDTWAGIAIILDSKPSDGSENEENESDKRENIDISQLGDKEHSDVSPLDNGEMPTINRIQKPRCLKDTHKLDTKSSTASESSFESLPYRMLSSQPDSFTDDVVIELTKAPPDSERLKLAKQELMRLERMNAISMASQYMTESRDEFSPEEKNKTICSTEADSSRDGNVLEQVREASSSALEEESNQDLCNSSLFDSGVDVMQSEHNSSAGSSITKLLPSPVESTTESGFSSLKEPLANEEEKISARDGVSLSKSKDSLDLTDTDRFPGTDTLSDDMETLSSNAGDSTLVESDPVSKEGSARGSISDSLNQEHVSGKSSSTTDQVDVNLDSFGIPNNYQNSHCLASCEVHSQWAASHRAQKSQDSWDQPLEAQEIQETGHEEATSPEVTSPPESTSPPEAATAIGDNKKSFSDDGSGSKMKTSESLSSEDTVVSKISLEEQSGKVRLGSQEEPFEVSDNQMKISPLDEMENLNNMNNLKWSPDRLIEEQTHTVISKRTDAEMCKARKSSSDVESSSSKGDNGDHIDERVCLTSKQVSKPIGEALVTESTDITTVVKSKERLVSGEDKTSGSTPLMSVYDTDEITVLRNGKKSSSSGLSDEVLGEASPPANGSADGSYSNKPVLSDSGKTSVENHCPAVTNETLRREECDVSLDIVPSVQTNGVPNDPRQREDPTSDGSGGVKVRKSDVSDKSSPNARETCSTDRQSRHSSKSGVSDLEDEVFLPPPENYIFDGRPVIYCPKIDMAKQVKVEPPKMAMSVFTVVPSKELGSSKGKDWKDVSTFGALPSMKIMYDQRLEGEPGHLEPSSNEAGASQVKEEEPCSLTMSPSEATAEDKIGHGSSSQITSSVETVEEAKKGGEHSYSRTSSSETVAEQRTGEEPCSVNETVAERKNRKEYSSLRTSSSETVTEQKKGEESCLEKETVAEEKKGKELSKTVAEQKKEKESRRSWRTSSSETVAEQEIGKESSSVEEQKNSKEHSSVKTSSSETVLEQKKEKESRSSFKTSSSETVDEQKRGKEHSSSRKSSSETVAEQRKGKESRSSMSETVTEEMKRKEPTSIRTTSQATVEEKKEIDSSSVRTPSSETVDKQNKVKDSSSPVTFAVDTTAEQELPRNAAAPPDENDQAMRKVKSCRSYSVLAKCDVVKDKVTENVDTQVNTQVDTQGKERLFHSTDVLLESPKHTSLRHSQKCSESQENTSVFVKTNLSLANTAQPLSPSITSNVDTPRLVQLDKTFTNVVDERQSCPSADLKNTLPKARRTSDSVSLFRYKNQESKESKQRSLSEKADGIPILSPTRHQTLPSNVQSLVTCKISSISVPVAGDVSGTPGQKRHENMAVSGAGTKESIRSEKMETHEHSKPKLSRAANLERKDTDVSGSCEDLVRAKKVEIKILENEDSIPREPPTLSPVSELRKLMFLKSTGSPDLSKVSPEIQRIGNLDWDGERGVSKKDHACQKKTKEENGKKQDLEAIIGAAISPRRESKTSGSRTSEESDADKVHNQSSIESGDSTISTKSESQGVGSLRNSGWCVGGSLEFLEKGTERRARSRQNGSISSAKSEDLSLKADKASLKSQGSLDKFPHFDQVSAQQKARGARKKILSVDIDRGEKGSKDTNKEMHRSATLPVGSLASAKREKEDKKKDKEDKSKKKKKEKEASGGGEKKSAMLSLKGLLKRNKSKEKEKDKDSSQEKLSSPSLFRKFERKSRSNTQSPLLDERKPGEQGKGTSSPVQDVDKTRCSPASSNGKARPVISSPVQAKRVEKPLDARVATAMRRSSAAAVVTSGSDSESPAGSLQSSPKRILSHPRKASLGNQPSPRLYRHVLTRHLSSSQESVDNPLLSSNHSSPQSSPHTSPKRKVMPVSASSYSLPASRDMSPPAPLMGTRALRGSSNSFSVTIGFKPTVEKRSRTMSEGADLNKVSQSPVSKRKEGSRILTQLNKRSSSMEILVCGKIREHCSDGGKSPARSPFSREGSFRLHREISVETLFELPETSPRSSRTQKDYQEYLEELHARNDSHHGSSCSLFEDSEADRHSEYLHRRSSHHSPAGKKLSLPYNVHLSGLREIATSNPNLQRSGSPFVRGMPHSSSFTSSPFRRPHSSASVFSPAKKFMSSNTGGPSPPEGTPGTPLMAVEEEGPCRKNLDSDTEKPPNVLVYAANKTEYFTAVQDTLKNCLNQDRYIIYHLTDEMAFKSPWPGSTTLLVVCGDVPAHISTAFIRYLLQGGRVLSVCSDFLNMAVPLFAFELPWTSSLVAAGTVEVQEQAVVSVSYQRWSGVQLLHHQHCFHSSPQHKRFSREVDRPKGIPTKSAVSVEPTHVEITDEWGGRHRLDLTILATDDTWGAPSLLSAKLQGSKGKAVFSQVHLERDPRECFGASEISAKLCSSNEARLEILRDLLLTELTMDTTQPNSGVIFTPAYFLGRHELKQELMNKLKPSMEGQEIRRPHLTMQFVSSGETTKNPEENVLPIYMNACPMTFSTVKYFEALKTKSIGRLIVYCDVMASTMKVTAGHPPLINGLAVVCTQQTQGRGRSGNSWLSPLGCAMFTIQVHVDLTSILGQHLSFLQHLIAIAVSEAVREQPGYEDIPVSLKWPNDIYVGSEMKIGGVIVEATTIGNEVIANVGCGVNLSNSNPTYCINDAVRQFNKENNTRLAEIEREVFLARTFNAFEELIDVFQRDGPQAVLDKYYKYWLHSGATVVVQNENLQSESAVITGIDSYGFLEAQLINGELITLHPDGNSFNMMQGLIYSKYHR